jgi:predicted AAA+ superfamily ATPase
MLRRLLKLPEKQSFFLFGPRGVGKTTLLEHLPFAKHAFFINLLKPDVEQRFAKNPASLETIVKALPEETTHIIIDEIQKLPKLLDMVHYLIESTDKYFILTGSSARKLKHGGANLLAGRAFVFDLFPFTVFELGEKFDLNEALAFGTLPKIFTYKTNESKQQYLRAYANTYLKEEIWAEQFIRELDPFRSFLEAAAQSNGKIINFSNIARDVGVTEKMVQKYYSILEDTLIGFFLNPFQHSFRKRLSKKPKFYFFDPGVVRTLCSQLSLPLLEKNSHYGELFEHFIILQCKQLANYYYPEYRFSFLKTKDDAEIDLIVERPGKPLLLIEIKSSDNVTEKDLSALHMLSRDIENCEAVCFSRDMYAKQYESILVLPWKEGLKRYFTTR